MKYSVRNFLVVFFMSIVIFAVAAVFLMQYISSTILSTPISDSDSDPIISTPGETSLAEPISFSKTCLILGLDEDGRADYILLLQINRQDNTFLLTNLPANLRIELDGGYRTLSDAALTHGINFVRDKVHALTSLKIDSLVTVEADGFVDIVDRFGGFTHNIPTAMQYADADHGIHIDLAAGQQTLSGKAALNALLYREYETDPELTRSNHCRALVLSMCRDILTAENNLMHASENLAELYNDITTDLTMDELGAEFDALFSFSSYTVTEFVYPGKSDGTYYLPDIAAASEAYKPFRAI